jgi:serine/threonine-protein kinase
MAIDSVPAFLDAIRQHNLLEPTQVTEAAQEGRRCSDPRTLAQQFIKKNWLTPFQINEIFRGQAGSLVLGQYRLLERLGEGGMGQVFKARHQTMGRIVAIKVIRKDRLENEKAIKRFRREIKAAAQLSHPNVALAFDADAVNGSHFLVMEYVDGTDLSRLIKQHGPLPVATACEYTRQAALGLQHAHERGLTHRDIKPGNLVVTKGEALNGPAAAAGRGKRTGGQTGKPLVKILDMGLASGGDYEGEATASISQDGTVMGTPDYMAPEQAKNSSNVDWRADIYSLGCTFYYLLTASVPFPGGSNIEKLIHHQMDQPRPVEAFRPDVPPGVRAILQRMMAKRLEDRIQSGGEVAHALAGFCENSSAPTSKKIPAAAIPLAMPRGASGGHATTSTFASIRNLFFDPQRHRVRQIGVLIGLAALVGLLGMFLLVLSLISGWAKSPTPATGTPLASARQTSKLPPPTPVKPPPTERRLNLDPIPRCLPDGANNVCTFKVQEFVRSAPFKQHEDLIKANLSEVFIQFQAFGISLYNDVDRAVYAVVAGGNMPEGVILLQGAFDTSKFQQTVEGNKQQFRLRRAGKAVTAYYEMPAGNGERARFVAMPNANTFLLVTEDRVMFQTLQKIAGVRPADLADKEVLRQVANLDDKPSVFLVIGGSFPGADGASLLSKGIRCMTAGFRAGDEVQGEFSVVARDNTIFQEIRGEPLPSIVTDVLRTILGDNGTLARSLVSGQPTVNQAANTVTLRARYPTMDVARFFQK